MTLGVGLDFFDGRHGMLTPAGRRGRWIRPARRPRARSALGYREFQLLELEKSGKALGTQLISEVGIACSVHGFVADPAGHAFCIGAAHTVVLDANAFADRRENVTVKKTPGWRGSR